MNTRIECIQGDIADQPDLGAVVNAANARLATGGGVAGAIHRAAGPGLAQECRPLAPIRPGQAVITGAHNLPNDYVIHCLGPVHGVDQPSARLLANCYENALRLAVENDIESVGFPAISTGAFGYPLEEAAEIAVTTVQHACRAAGAPRLVRFVLFDEQAVAVHRRVLESLERR